LLFDLAGKSKLSSLLTGALPCQHLHRFGSLLGSPTPPSLCHGLLDFTAISSCIPSLHYFTGSLASSIKI
jgi:hypothetical protein